MPFALKLLTDWQGSYIQQIAKLRNPKPPTPCLSAPAHDAGSKPLVAAKIDLIVSSTHPTSSHIGDKAMPIPDRIIRVKSVLAATGLSRSTLYRKVKKGTFPPKFKISTQCSGWYESAVKTWMANPQFYHVNDFPQTPSL